MRRVDTKKAYRLEIAPAVWRDVGQVPSDAFKRMQAELENIAELASVSVDVERGKSRSVLHRVHVDAFEGIYEVDPDRRVVRLVSVHRSPRGQR